jgi:hypothetical protein
LKSISIIPSFSKQTAFEGEELKITVSLENNAATDINAIELRSAFPKVLNPKGVTSGFADLPKSSTKDIFSFSITPDIVNGPTLFNLTFTADFIFAGQKYSINKISAIKILPIVPDVDFQKSLQKDSSYMGETLDVSYIITNKAIDPVKNINIVPQGVQDFDMINTFSYSIDNLDPGEQKTFTVGKIRPKKAGKLDVGRSIVYYSDKYNRMFNTTSGNPAILVEKADINGPAIYITLSSDKTMLSAPGTAILSINLTNLGTQSIKGNLSEFGPTDVLFIRSKSFEKNITFTNPGNNVVEPYKFRYEYQGNVYEATSNELLISVLNSNEHEPEELIPPLETSTGNENNNSDKQVKGNIFTRFFNWLAGFFKKN